MKSQSEILKGCKFEFIERAYRVTCGEKDIKYGNIKLCPKCWALLEYNQEIIKMINNFKVRLILTLNANSKCDCINMTDKYGNIAELIINEELRQKLLGAKE